MATILYLSTIGEISGAERSLLAMLDALDRDAWTPAVAAPAGPLLDEVAARGIAALPLPLLPLHRPRTLAALWATPQALREGWRAVGGAVQQVAPAIIHANTTRAMLYALRAAPRLPVIWHVRDLAGSGPWEAWLYNRAARVAVISAAVARHVQRFTHGSAKLALLPPAVDTAHFQPVEDRAAVRERLGLPADGPLIGLVAQFVPWKRHHLFLDALAMLTDYPWQAVLAGADLHGDQAYIATIKERLAHGPLKGRVHLLDWQADPAPLMQALDIGMLTSEHEPFGRALIEAMACGAAVIAVDEDGPRDIIEPGVNGLLTPAEPADLAVALAALLANPEQRGAMGAAGRVQVEQRFSLAAQREALSELYASSLARA